MNYSLLLLVELDLGVFLFFTGIVYIILGFDRNTRSLETIIKLFLGSFLLTMSTLLLFDSIGGIWRLW